MLKAVLITLRCSSFRFAGGNLLLTCVISLLRIALKPSLILKASAHMQVMELFVTDNLVLLMSSDLPVLSKVSLIPLDYLQTADSIHP